MRRLRNEAGVTLIELLVAMVLMSVVLIATLTAFDALQDDHLATERHTESMGKARSSVQRLSRELRNLASPTALATASANQPQAIDRAQPFDLIFRTVDATKAPTASNPTNVMRVRYCLVENPSNKRRWRMWVQTKRYTGVPDAAAPSSTSCPGTGWDDQVLHTTEVVNTTKGGASVPVFTYAPACAASTCTTTEMQRITKVRVDLVIDNDPDRRPAATRLSTSVILRNQNQFPSARFQITVLDNNRNLRLDASSSTDPEGQPLKYCWFSNATGTLPPCSAAASNSAYIGEGVVLSYRPPTAGSRTIQLRVEDPAGLGSETSQTGTF